ncbi:MAG: LapA family protein [Deltaproteobacteria bacterium]|nr:LapA family protein [Deltaproteobacteria bacterium]
MRFLKIIFTSLLTILGLIFILQNRTALEQTVQLSLDLYLKSFTSANIPLWLLIIFSFFLGVFTTSLYGFYELIKQRQTIRHLRQNLEIMGNELKRAGATGTAADRPLRTSPAAESSSTPSD